MDDTPYVNDGADASLRKTVSLLNKIEANTSSTPTPVTLGTSSNPNVVKLNYFAGGAVGTDGGPTDLTAVRVGYNSDSGNEFLVVSESTGLPISGIDLGAKADSVASSDTGAFSVLAFIKRGLQNWTTLLAKIPTLVSGRIPVDGSGVTQPVSGTVGLDSTSLAALENISVTFPATQNVNVTNAGLSVSVSNLPATQPVSGSVSVSNFPATQPVSLATAPTTPVTGTFWQATQPVSIASAPVTPVTDNGGSLTVDGTVTVNDMTSGNAKTKIVDSTGADVSYIPAGTAGTPSSSVLSVQGISGGTVIGINSSHVGDGIQAYLNDYGNDIPVSNQSITNIDADLGATTDSAATTDTGTFSAIALIKRGLQNWTTLLARIPALVSGRIPVEAAQATNANLKAQAQLLNSAGSLITYAESGTYGSPSVDVISVQNPQGTSAAIATFTSTTASTSLVSAATARKTLTVYNSGPGDLNISPTATCTTTNFQIRLASNDYWECPDQQVTMAHTAVFSSAGTAYVTTIS